LIQGLDKFTAEYNEKLRKTGLDPDKAAQDASGLQRTFGSLAASISIIGQKVASNLFTGENNAFQKFIEFLDAHGDEIANVISHIAQVVLELARALLELVTSPEAKKWLDTMLLAFGDIDKETGRFTANVDKMKVALGLFGTFVATSWLSKILGAFGLFGGAWTGLLTRLGIPVAIGAAATAHGYQTPEEYQASLKADPSAKAFDDERKAQGGGLKRLIGRGVDAVKRGASAVAHAFTGGEAEAHVDTPRGSGRGNAGAARTGEMMRYAMDQLRREGVPEDHVKQAAAHLVGQATMESQLNPNTVHDNGTGYGIYGARDPGGRGRQRRTEMLQWLEKNGYARNSAEGQMREMVHRAMSGQYPRTKAVLMGRGSGDIGADTTAITREFEAPKFINDRSGAVRNALRVGAEASSASVGRQVAGLDGQLGIDLGNGTMRMPSGAIRSIPANAPTASAPSRKPITAQDILPRGMEGVFNGGLPNFTLPQAPASNFDSSRTTHVTIHQGDVTVHGIDNPKQAAGEFSAVQGYRNSDLIRNMRPTLT
jgi:hypothetical protein